MLSGWYFCNCNRLQFGNRLQRFLIDYQRPIKTFWDALFLILLFSFSLFYLKLSLHFKTHIKYFNLLQTIIKSVTLSTSSIGDFGAWRRKFSESTFFLISISLLRIIPHILPLSFSKNFEFLLGLEFLLNPRLEIGEFLGLKVISVNFSC